MSLLSDRVPAFVGQRQDIMAVHHRGRHGDKRGLMYIERDAWFSVHRQPLNRPITVLKLDAGWLGKGIRPLKVRPRQSYPTNVSRTVPIAGAFMCFW